MDKKYFIIFCELLFAFSACSNQDDAVSSNYNDNQIIIAEKSYKNYQPQLNYSAVAAAAAYFDSIREIYPKHEKWAYQAARAYYYKAVGEHENDNIVSACESFLKAAEIMESSFSIKELQKNVVLNRDKIRFHALIYVRLADIMFYENCTNQSKDSYAKANSLLLSINDSIAIAQTYTKIGNVFLQEGDWDNAFISHKKAIVFSKSNDNISSNSWRSIAKIYYNKGQTDSAYHIIRNLIENTEGESRILSKTVAAHMLHHEKKYDSAIVYFNEGFNSKNKYTKIFAAKNLSEIYRELGDESKSLYYKNLYSDNYFEELARSSSKSEIINLYENFLKNKTSAAYIVNRKYNRTLVIIIMIMYFIIIIMIIIKHTASIKVSRKNIEELNCELLNLKKDKASDFEEAIRLLSKDNSYSKIYCASKTNIKSTNTNSYYELILNNEERVSFVDAVNRYFNGFAVSLNSKYPKLNFDDQLCCCLILVGMKEKEIGALMGVQYQSVKDRTRKLASIFKSCDIHNLLVEYAETGLYN